MMLARGLIYQKYNKTSVYLQSTYSYKLQNGILILKDFNFKISFWSSNLSDLHMSPIHIIH